MAIRIYDPSVLNAQGALVDLSAIDRQRGGQGLANGRVRGEGRALFLRWQTSPGAGLPSEPFKVWRRPALPFGEHRPVAFEAINLPPAMLLLQFDRPLGSVALTVTSGAGGAIAVGVLSGPPIIESVVTVQTRTLPAGGAATLEFQGSLITGLLLVNVSNFASVVGMTVEELERVQGFELVETVGLPVREAEWAPIGQRHGVKQGRVGAELEAIDAAVERYRRGVNPLGWWPTLPGGAPAPAWQMPEPEGLIRESESELLPMLRELASMPPEQQASRLFQFVIPPPQNPAGATMPAAQSGQADLSPIGLLAMSIASDPLLAVALGYGTGYADEDLPRLNVADRPFFADASKSDWDWLVTGLWEHGLDGASQAVEFAALIPRPPLGMPAPVPADLTVDFQANLRPAAVDRSWLASIRTSWERFPQTQLARVASFAAARQRTGSAAAAEALLEKHLHTLGHRPIANTLNVRDPEPTRQSATDGALPVPNDPGFVQMTYAAATQNIFGIWSPWAAAPIQVKQPDPALVPILSAEFKPSDPGTGSSCPATLLFELSVDWRVRSVQRIELRGQLFAAASRSTAAPAGPTPPGLQKQLAGPFVTAHILFAGDVPSLPGGTVESLDAQGTARVAPGAATQGTSRRYRVTIPGFSLDYAATQHVGVALAARVVERIAPARTGIWSPAPKLAYASDPRARPTTVIDLVRLSSLPDAAGECHAHIAWAALPGALGYALYESTETRILTSHPGAPEPTPDRTLSQRLTTLKTAFASAPLRRDFVRRNSNLLTTNHADVTLPRGSRDIHLYVVLPVMAGGNEGPWPSGPNADASLIPYAAPRVAEPAPPTIEVQLVSDKPPAAPNFRARVRVGTRGAAGARPKRIDIHRVRVDDAARRLDSMGPPIAALDGSGGGWLVAPPAAGGDWIESVTGFDQPSGSWRTVWYRAVAWSEDDLVRGVLKGRSQASPAVSVLVPPPAPPDLSPLAISWPGGDPAAVLIRFTSAAQIAPTPLGPHKLTLEATTAGSSLLRVSMSLDALPQAEPSNGSGIWRSNGSPSQYRVLLRRAALSDAVSVVVRITDPVGRTTERVIKIAAGSVLPLPTLSPIEAIVIGANLKVFTFATDAPDRDPAGGSYRLRVELTPAPIRVPLRPPATPLRPVRSQFKLIDGVYVFDAPLSSVPPLTTPLDPSSQNLAIGRQRAPLQNEFAILVPLALRSVAVWIEMPDGRTVTRRARG